MQSMCDQDTATAMIDTGICNIGKIVLVSIYWDGRINTFPELAIKAMEKANEDDETSRTRKKTQAVENRWVVAIVMVNKFSTAVLCVVMAIPFVSSQLHRHCYILIA